MFARVLVDIDMLSPFSDHLLVERSNYTFVDGVEYEWLPPFCSHCKMIGQELAQCRVIHYQGRVPGPQYKSSQKIISEEWDQGRTVTPKQRKEYRKKDSQPKLVEDPTDKLNIVVPDKADAGSPLGHLASDKSGGVEDVFADMPPFEDVSDHESKQGLSTHTSNFPVQGMLPVVMQAKGSVSHAPIEDLHVEISPPVVVPSSLCPTSPQRAKSPTDSTTPINTPIDGHHVETSAIVIVPSPSLACKITFHLSRVWKLQMWEVILILVRLLPLLKFDYDHITVENEIGSKVWVDPNEMEEDVSDTGEKIVRIKRKPGRPPKGTGKSKKITKTILTTMKVFYFLWNVRGLGNHKTVEMLLSLLKLYKPLLVFVAEPMMLYTNVFYVLYKFVNMHLVVATSPIFNKSAKL